MNNLKLRDDKYRRIRGGKSAFMDIFCMSCNSLVLHYQKDGDGNLMRCYLNRILSPEIYNQLQYQSKVTSPKDMPPLVCGNCQAIIGSPMEHLDGRLAYRLRKEFYYKKKSL